MPGFTTDESATLLLNYLTGRSAVFTPSRNTYLGLAFTLPDNSPPTLATIGEVTGGGYSRQQALWSAPTGSPVSIATSATIQFGPMAEDMTSAVTYAFLTDASAGTSGIVLYVWNLLEPVVARAAQSVYVAAGALTIQ